MDIGVFSRKYSQAELLTKCPLCRSTDPISDETVTLLAIQFWYRLFTFLYEAPRPSK